MEPDLRTLQCGRTKPFGNSSGAQALMSHGQMLLFYQDLEGDQELFFRILNNSQLQMALALLENPGCSA